MTVQVQHNPILYHFPDSLPAAESNATEQALLSALLSYLQTQNPISDKIF